jgi:hypothetical protein
MNFYNELTISMAFNLLSPFGVPISPEVTCTIDLKSPLILFKDLGFFNFDLKSFNISSNDPSILKFLNNFLESFQLNEDHISFLSNCLKFESKVTIRKDNPCVDRLNSYS